MPRIQIDLPARDLEAIEALARSGFAADAEAVLRYIVADWLEMQAQTPQYLAMVERKLAEAEGDMDAGRDMDEVFDALELELSKITTKAS
jgi:Arc/MetJ-type ribon-helix-helix transcriptional regulator